MNREIKFRAWEPQYKLMSPVTHIDFIAGELDCEHNAGEPKSIEHFELMQYTGLKDRNGKEIYEGDIFIINEFDDSWYDKVIFKNGQFNLAHFRNAVTDIDLMYATKSDNCRVVGNIHENPELN